WMPLEGRGLTVGPRIGGDFLFGTPPRPDRQLTLGAEATLWLMNAIGLGAAADYAVAIAGSVSGSGGWAMDPHFRVRLERLGVGGALALHLAPVYETQYGFGWRAGLIVEFSGVLGP